MGMPVRIEADRERSGKLHACLAPPPLQPAQDPVRVDALQARHARARVRVHKDLPVSDGDLRLAHLCVGQTAIMEGIELACHRVMSRSPGVCCIWQAGRQAGGSRHLLPPHHPGICGLAVNEEEGSTHNTAQCVDGHRAVLGDIVMEPERLQQQSWVE